MTLSVSPSMCSWNSGQLFLYLCYSLKMSLVNNLHKIAFLYHTCNLTYMKQILLYKVYFFWEKLDFIWKVLTVSWNITSKDGLSKDIFILLTYNWNFLAIFDNTVFYISIFSNIYKNTAFFSYSLDEYSSSYFKNILTFHYQISVTSLLQIVR